MNVDELLRRVKEALLSQFAGIIVYTTVEGSRGVPEVLVDCGPRRLSRTGRIATQSGIERALI